jgi:hypothetical protein
MFVFPRESHFTGPTRVILLLGNWRMNRAKKGNLREYFWLRGMSKIKIGFIFRFGPLLIKIDPIFLQIDIFPKILVILSHYLANLRKKDI